LHSRCLPLPEAMRIVTAMGRTTTTRAREIANASACAPSAGPPSHLTAPNAPGVAAPRIRARAVATVRVTALVTMARAPGMAAATVPGDANDLRVSALKGDYVPVEGLRGADTCSRHRGKAAYIEPQCSGSYFRSGLLV